MSKMATTNKKGGCCKEQEEKNRRQMVSEILKSAYFPQTKRAKECVNIYAKSLLSIEEILNITEPSRNIQKRQLDRKSRIFRL